MRPYQIILDQIQLLLGAGFQNKNWGKDIKEYESNPESLCESRGGRDRGCRAIPIKMFRSNLHLIKRFDGIFIKFHSLAENRIFFPELLERETMKPISEEKEEDPLTFGDEEGI